MNNYMVIKQITWKKLTDSQKSSIFQIEPGRNRNTWRLNYTFLNNQQVTEEIKRETLKFLETNDNENRTTQNLCDAAKAVLRGEFIAIQCYHKRQEKH